MNQKRKTLLVDKEIQLKMAANLVFYWLTSIFSVVLLVAIFQTFNGSDTLLVDNLLNVIKQHAVVFLGMLAFLPLIVLHSLKLPLRFAGPIHRLRKDLARLEKGENVEFSFRDTDFWKDIPQSLNALVSKIEELENQVTEEMNRDSISF
ncbi:MAG: hypothetical protein GY819_19150 [Planctomycetaceae bacterium]|nr:hypothetical protein [Planctomycetaceae bacterium]MCP4464916.1 hypothetical protein [Planctomycetaceae bacterium]MDG1808806.1 hypothetical protein [Pirellulaceae bacterium]MDG2102862.1 hypothetical protein [Pirellulaceae bacterium]